MEVSEFDYHLPPQLIAQRPLPQRDASRLLLLHRDSGQVDHRHFSDLLHLLRPGDVLVFNDSRVIPARLFGRKPTGGKAEILLLKQLDETHWQALIGGKRLRSGGQITILDRGGHETAVRATITKEMSGAQREIQFSQPIAALLDDFGHTPLPPYIHETLTDPERYQTIFARHDGSAAAPTAGLHFSPELLLALREKGVILEMTTLHVGLDTFQPIAVDKVQEHVIHSEWAQLTPETARRINEAKLAGGRLVAVGTTAVRTLETAALRSAGINGSLQDISARDAQGETSNLCPWKPVAAFSGQTDLFLYPGYRFRAVDALLTNFHLPRSSLLLLVSAFAGRDRILPAYQTAVKENYRFYSFGDAMFIV